MQKDYRIYEICLKETAVKVSASSRLKATKIVGQRKSF